MNLQAFRLITVNPKAALSERRENDMQGRRVSLRKSVLPAGRREDAERQHTDTTALQAERNVDVGAVDIVAIAAENIGDLVLSAGIQPAEHADAQFAKVRSGEAEAGGATFVTACQDQRNVRRQLRLYAL